LTQKPESVFYQSCLKPFLLTCGFICERIENHSVAGFPDLYCKGLKKDFHSEIKIGVINKSGIVNVSWQPGQIAWGRRQLKLGLKYFVFIKINGKSYYTIKPQAVYKISELKILDKGFYF